MYGGFVCAPLTTDSVCSNERSFLLLLIDPLIYPTLGMAVMIFFLALYRDSRTAPDPSQRLPLVNMMVRFVRPPAIGNFLSRRSVFFRKILIAFTGLNIMKVIYLLAVIIRIVPYGLVSKAIQPSVSVAISLLLFDLFLIYAGIVYTHHMKKSRLDIFYSMAVCLIHFVLVDCMLAEKYSRIMDAAETFVALLFRFVIAVLSWYVSKYYMIPTPEVPREPDDIVTYPTLGPDDDEF